MENTRHAAHDCGAGRLHSMTQTWGDLNLSDWSLVNSMQYASDVGAYRGVSLTRPHSEWLQGAWANKLLGQLKKDAPVQVKRK